MPEEVDADLGEAEILQEYYKPLEMQRAAGHGVKPIRCKDFQAALRGSDKRIPKYGSKFDAWQGQVQRHSDAGDWCRQNKLHVTMKFNMNLGESNALTLAESWADKMQYLYDCSRDGQMETRESQQACLDAYDEPDKLRSLMENAEGALAVEAVRIRSLQPQ